MDPINSRPRPDGRSERARELSARACRQAIDLQRTCDDLLAQAIGDPLSNDVEVELLLGPPALLVSFLADDLGDALHRADKLGQSHAADDLATRRTIAGSIDSGRLAA